MRCERYALDGDPAPLVAQLRGMVSAAASVSEAVAEIIAAVRQRGDAAVLEYTRALDTGGAEPQPLRVPEHELDAAAEALEPEVRLALERAVENVEAVAGHHVELGDGGTRRATHQVRLRRFPVSRAGVYVPSGRAPYPSTVVMGVVPARVAGVEQIAVCAPPGPDGAVSPLIAGACRLAGATALYRMGGAQSIAALALGTETVAPVDVIVGPGNLYVQEAKRQLSGVVGIDGFAGPSDLIVIADPGANPEPIALDLLAQAEHGDGTIVVGVSRSGALLDTLADQLASAPETGAAAAMIEVDGPAGALSLAQAFAPEHLELIGAEAEALAERATRAGVVFVGELSGTAFGDYIAGSNHILPTGGAARFASGLTPATFLRTVAEVTVTEPSELARAAAPLARAEGFELHARSMEARIRDNQPG